MAQTTMPTESDLTDICRLVLGAAPDAIEYPGGKSRKTVVILLKGQRIVVSKRRSAGRAQLEAEVLHRLAPANLAPRLLHRRGPWLFQEFVAGQRVSEALSDAGQERQREVLLQACRSLGHVQRAGNSTGLGKIAPAIGYSRDWLNQLLHSPNRLAASLDLDPPVFDIEKFRTRVKPNAPSFIKWDARPANAILTQDNRVVWIDWEHAGCRNAQDDLAWLFADEWTPDHPALEGECVSEFREKACSNEEFIEHWRTMAILHSCIRLSLIFSKKGEGPWWPRQRSLELDQIGVVPDLAQRVAKRAERWCLNSEATKVLSPMFSAVQNRILENR